MVKESIATLLAVIAEQISASALPQLRSALALDAQTYLFETAGPSLRTAGVADLDQSKCILVGIRERDDALAFAQVERLVQTGDASTFEVHEPSVEVVDAKDRHERAADTRRGLPDSQMHLAEIALIVIADRPVCVRRKG